MDSLEFNVLEACQEFMHRQQDMLPRLGAALDVPAEHVFYKLVLRGARNRGRLKDEDWSYYPHGYECDLKNIRDGRYLRIDFGPGGRVGILNSWGVLQFIMTSVSPWRDFPLLRMHFAKGSPPFDQYSGDSSKMSLVWDRLTSMGAFQQAAPDLVALQAKYSSRGPDGLTYIKYPAEISDETRLDCAVAHRQVLSPVGLQLLNAGSRKANRIESAPADSHSTPRTIVTE
ncbi:MAG: hypothetical protein HYR84_16405 [Planctomycetes bacterium]|nr:hypothetical protein [Planctomycetota bacterium]